MYTFILISINQVETADSSVIPWSINFLLSLIIFPSDINTILTEIDLIENHSAKTFFKVQQFRQAFYQSITTKLSFKIILKMKQYFWTKMVYLFRSSSYYWEMRYMCWKVTYQIINPFNNRWIFLFVVKILFIVVITITTYFTQFIIIFWNFYSYVTFVTTNIDIRIIIIFYEIQSLTVRTFFLFVVLYLIGELSSHSVEPLFSAVTITSCVNKG